MKRKFSRVLAFLLAIALGIAIVPVSSANAVYAASSSDLNGSGTENDPYLISTADDLVAIQEAVNSGTSYSGCYFQLTADITLPSDWTAIGTSSSHFYGTFDGAGYTITFPEGYTTADSYVGLFGLAGTYTDMVTIKDLTLEGEITATSALSAGALAGFVSGYVENCVSNVSLDVTQYNSEDDSEDGKPVDSSISDMLYTGGLIGSIAGGSISGCVNNGDITYNIVFEAHDGNRGYSISVCAGGLVGNVTYLSSYPTEIENSMNTGDITVASCNVSSDNNSSSGVYFGCLVGYAVASAAMSACVNTGSISLSSSVSTSYISMGSINGYTTSGTDNCYTSFDIEESYSSYSAEGDEVTYVESFELETIWFLNTLNGSQDNSMFWTLSSDDEPAPATDEDPAVVRVLYQFSDGTEEAVYVKAGSTASLPDDHSDAVLNDFVPDKTVVTEDITVTENEEETSHSYEAVVTDPTCEEQGYTTYTCTGCGTSYTDDYTDALGHDYSGNVCTVCGAVLEDDLANAEITLSGTSFSFTGSAIEPEVTIVINGTTLTEGTDYTLSYSNNYVVGTAAVTATGTGSYTGSISAEFTIVECEHTWDSGTVTRETSCTLKGIITYTCTNCGETKTEYIDKIDHEYTGNVCKYCGKLKSSSISSASVTLSYTSCTYNGSSRKPSVTVKVNGTTLTKGTDYTVTYSDNKNVGTATVTITGSGDYSGSTSTTFTIKAKSIASESSNAKVTLSKTSYTYNGSSRKPTPTVKITLNGSTKKLTKGTDYTVTYKNNKSAGTATVVIKGTGNYKGTIKKTFTIKKASQTLKVTKSTKTVKYSKVKSAKQKVKAITKVSGAKGTVTYTKTAGSKYLTVNKSTGKITVKKGTPKGTYKIKVKVKSASTTNYKSASKAVTITIKVK